MYKICIWCIYKILFFVAGTCFVIGNAQVEGFPVIYCTKSICELTGYAKADLVQKSCALEFLCGPETDPNSISNVRKALQNGEEKEVFPVTYYKKDGKFYFIIIFLKKVVSFMCCNIKLFITDESISYIISKLLTLKQ